MGSDEEEDLTDGLADKILSGTVAGALNAPLIWKQKNAPKKNAPIHVEAHAPVRTDLSCRLELRMRIGCDKPWGYTVLLLHVTSRACLRRLDIRGTHLARGTGETFINRTHKHKWSKKSGNKEVYSPDDIRHTPDPIVNATLANMDEEYDRVVRDFIAECKMMVGGGYVWVPPPQVTPSQPTFEGLEDYP